MVFSVLTRIFNAAILAHLLASTVIASNCYFPQGDIGVNDVVCFPLSQESFCCGPGYACLENQLCMKTAEANDGLPNGFLNRGSCTDQSFNSTACPQFCNNAGSKYNYFEYTAYTRRKSSNLFLSQSARRERSHPMYRYDLLLWW